jgi:hypothetical protein
MQSDFSGSSKGSGITHQQSVACGSPMMLPQQVLLPQSKINVAAYARMICTHLVAHHISAVCSIRTAATLNDPVNDAEDAAPC